MEEPRPVSDMASTLLRRVPQHSVASCISPGQQCEKCAIVVSHLCPTEAARYWDCRTARGCHVRFSASPSITLDTFRTLSCLLGPRGESVYRWISCRAQLATSS